MVLAFVTDW